MSGTQPGRFANPLDVALGDPFVLRHRGRFYLYGTNDGPPLADGRQIPVLRSDDLLRWEPLGGALLPAEGPAADYWAPEVLAWNGRFYMVVSFGDVEHRGHALWVAVADRPEGPFTLRQRLSDPADAFSIDGSWLLDDDGRLYLFRCLDFVAEDDPPHGTGIVVQPMADPLTPAGPPVTVLRAHSPWQLFEADRPMPLYGGRRFAAWNTIEGPAPVRRAGRYFCGYSGGNYTGAYGTGEAVADAPLGPYADLRGREGPIFGSVPGLVEGPGHFSVVRPDLVHDWIVLHGRRPGEGARRVWLCPASWAADGVTIGALTDRPQPAPPLPTEQHHLAGAGLPAGWHVGDGWGPHVDGLAYLNAVPGRAWRAGPDLTGDWDAEVYVRFPVGADATAGLVLAAGGGELRASVAPAAGLVRVVGADGAARDRPAPTLGTEPFDPSAFHPLAIRCRAGLAEVRLDGVVVAEAVTVPAGPARLGLEAEGPAIFDAVAVTIASP